MQHQIIKNIVYELVGKFNFSIKDPIFIIGTGRCGTSLLVRIMNSHNELIGFPGEANELWHPKSYPFRKRQVETPTILEDPKKFTNISLQAWKEGHDQKIINVFSGFKLLRGINKKLFIKSAMISFMIPQIISIFPDAKFIHIYRNGPSVVASLMKKEWSKYSNYFNNEFNYQYCCATYWNACISEIEEKKNQLSLEEKGILYEFSYENLCDTPIKVMQSIAEFLDIDPDGFKFDFSNINSKNFKVGEYKKDKEWLPLLQAMSPAMKIKGYD